MSIFNLYSTVTLCLHNSFFDGNPTLYFLGVLLYFPVKDICIIFSLLSNNENNLIVIIWQNGLYFVSYGIITFRFSLACFYILEMVALTV